MCTSILLQFHYYSFYGCYYCIFLSIKEKNGYFRLPFAFLIGIKSYIKLLNDVDKYKKLNGKIVQFIISLV